MRENMGPEYGVILLLVCLFVMNHAALYPGAIEQAPINDGPPQDMTQGWMPINDKQADLNYIRALQPKRNYAKEELAAEKKSVDISLKYLDQTVPKMAFPAWLHKQISPFLPVHLLLQLPAPQRPPATPASRPLHQTSEQRVPVKQLPKQRSLAQLPPLHMLPLSRPSRHRFPRQPLARPPPPPLAPQAYPPQQPQEPSPFDSYQPLNVPQPHGMHNMPPPQGMPSPHGMPNMPPPQGMPSPFGMPNLPPQNMAYMPPPMYGRPGSAECSGAYVPGQLCCDGIVNPLPPGGIAQWGCCHKGILDITKQVCCGDIPVPKPTKGPPLMCCGTALYNPATHLCCDTFPVPNPSGLMRCCRKVAYSPATEMCCAESVRPRVPLQIHMECCGKHMYNSRTHMCCDEGNAIPKDPTYQCCGKNYYQPSIQQCCFGDALPKDGACMAK